MKHFRSTRRQGGEFKNDCNFIDPIQNVQFYMDHPAVPVPHNTLESLQKMTWPHFWSCWEKKKKKTICGENWK